jgi:hypothetical protein
MVELNTLMIVGLIGFGGGVLVTVAMVLLYMAYNNINVVMDRTEEKKDDDEDEGFVIPMSALMGGGGGGGRALSMADLQAYAAATQGKPAPPATDDTKKAGLGGQYL